MTQVEAGGTPVSPGALLRKARSEGKLTVEEIAATLHLRKQQVIALEEDRYDVFPAPIYAKGQVRNYARLLGLDVETVSAAFGDQARRQSISEKPLSCKAPPKVNPMSGRQVPIAAALTLAVALALWWRAADQTFPAADLTSMATAKSVSAEQSIVSNAVALDDTNTVVADPVEANASTDIDVNHETTDGNTLVPALDASPVSIASTSPVLVSSVAEFAGMDTAPKPSDKLVFSFSADCWVQVKDRNNNVLISGTKRADEILALSGDAPFSIVLGYAPGVELTYNGDPVEISNGGADQATRFVVGRS